MTTLVEPALARRDTNGFAHFGRWCGDAWRLLRRAPFRFTLLALTPLVVEAMIQAMPRIGILLSKCIVPIAGMWILFMIDAKARNDGFAPLAAARALAARPLHVAAYTALSLVIFVFQLGTAAVIGGLDQAYALATGDLAALRYTRVELALVLAGGAVPAALTMFAAPRLALSGDGIVTALRNGVATTARHARPVLVYALCTMAVLTLLVWQPLALLVLLPWFGLIGYTAYRDVGAA